ncbi:MAG: hypothetical protein RLZZ502_1198 [Pseudomonadota bacterium]|jgi:4-oxalomesaconate tautomerase
MQRYIPCHFMRGGTSRGPFFLASDLPAEIAIRDQVLLAVMGSPDARQIDGLGGGTGLTSKVGIVSVSAAAGVDLDFLFAQVSVQEAKVDTTPNCGNMLAAALPFALEKGLLKAQGETTTYRVRTVNTGTLADITVCTPKAQNGQVRYDGEVAIAGVPGTAAAVDIAFCDTAGSVCGTLLPTGNTIDKVDGIAVTCVDNGMPVVVLRAQDLGVMGNESPALLNQNTELKAKLEAIRCAIGPRMNLGEVSKKVVPKMCLISPPKAGGHVATRTFIPHECHSAIGVLGAVSVATACALPGSVAEGIAKTCQDQAFSLEHPTGEFSLHIEQEPGQIVPRSVKLVRTARVIMRGEVAIPAHIWK